MLLALTHSIVSFYVKPLMTSTQIL